MKKPAMRVLSFGERAKEKSFNIFGCFNFKIIGDVENADVGVLRDDASGSAEMILRQKFT